MKTQNLHLVPEFLQDLAFKIEDKNIKMNEKNNYIIRVETIRDYCNEVLANKNISKFVK